MAIRNALMGGTDWTDGEILDSADLNDTFDKVWEEATAMPAFWLNSEFYDVYDNFNSYSTGSFTSNTDWTVTLSNGSADIEAQDYWGQGSSNILTLEANIGGNDSGTKTATAKTINLAQNKHKFARVAYNLTAQRESQTASAQFKFTFGSQTQQTIKNWNGANDENKGTGVITFNIVVVAKGSNVYDVYVGEDLIYSDVTETDPQLEFQAYANVSPAFSARRANGKVHVDDVIEAKYAVS